MLSTDSVCPAWGGAAGTATDSARAFACAFAADYLSWDEIAPDLRRVVLAGYLQDLSFARAGWDGRGRQRVDMVVPGVPVVLPNGLVKVPVAVQVMSFVAAGVARGAHATPMRPPDRAAAPPFMPPFMPSTAPDPTDPGWVPQRQDWLQLDVLVGLHEGQLSIAPETVGPPVRIL